MEKIMAVLTGEKKYAERLCSYCNSSRRLILTAVPFDDPEDYMEFSKKHKVELLLADSHFLKGSGMGYDSSGKRELKAGRIISLEEGFSFDRALADSAGSTKTSDSINKYQPAEILLREIMNSCSDMEIMKTAEVLGRPVRIIGVYSPVSRCGKTSFALTLCKALSKKQKTLYLTLEEFSNLENLTGEKYSVCLSDALYHMKQGSLNGQKIYSMIYSWNGVDYIPPIRYADDRNAVSGEDYVRLIHEILRNTDYENIVVDMNRFADEASEILEICTTIYMPVLENDADRMKTEHFIRYLNGAEREDLSRKIRMIRTPEPEPFRGRSAWLDSLLYGKMGDLVRELKEG